MNGEDKSYFKTLILELKNELEKCFHKEIAGIKTELALHNLRGQQIKEDLEKIPVAAIQKALKKVSDETIANTTRIMIQWGIIVIMVGLIVWVIKTR